MKCEKCGSRNIEAVLALDHYYVQGKTKNEWLFQAIAYPGEPANLYCLDCEAELGQQHINVKYMIPRLTDKEFKRKEELRNGQAA